MEGQAAAAQLIAEALLGDSPMARLMDAPHAKGVNFELSGIVTISEDSRQHARVWVEPRTSAAQIRTGEYSEEMLSLYVIIRQWSGGRKLPELHELQAQLIDVGTKFIDDHVVLPFLTPIRAAIARRN